MVGSERVRILVGCGGGLALLLALLLALPSDAAGAVPLPTPRPEGTVGSAAPKQAPAPPVIDMPLPLPRPEEDGPPIPPVQSDIPLPPPHPEEDGPPMPLATTGPRDAFGPPMPLLPLEPPLPPQLSGSSPAPAGGMPPPEPDLACAGLLAGGKVVARAEPSVLGTDGCGITAPVTLEAVILRSGLKVPLSPPPLIRCDMAEQLADWIRDDVATVQGDDGDLLGVADAAGYVCRGRNGLPGARLSEHARGNAVDVVGFRFAKRVIALKQADAHGFWTMAKTTACARFSTVLGPGSDGFHETNLHLDLEHRRNGSRLCEWNDP